MEYHYLLSGLEDLQLGSKSKMNFEQLLEFLKEQMAPSDWKLIELLQRRNDDPIIIAKMEGDDMQDRFRETNLAEDDFRTQILYEQGMKCRNRFVRDWYEFNLNLNNVLAAAVCQKHGYDTSKVIVGENEVAELLRRGNLTKNSNLSALLPDLKEMIAVSELQDLLDRERHIDALRWQWIENRTLFEYFEIDNVLAYYLQANILHRWDDLTREQGEQIFRQLLADLKKDVKF